MADSAARRWFFRRVVVVIAVCTLLLTAAFIGVIAHLTQPVTGLFDRVPYYLVVGALLFVGTIVLFEESVDDGSRIIVSALVTSLFGFALVGMAAEGIRFSVMNPGQIVTSQLVLYLFAASLIGTGVGYWALNHWREFSGGDAEPETEF